MSSLLIQFDQQSKIVQRMSCISFNEYQFRYRFDCQLSQGSFGKVCRIQEIVTKKYYALKKVTVKKKHELEDIQNEIKLLFRFKHPFVVQIKETYNIQIRSGFAKPIGEVGLIMELAKCSLEHIIRTKNTAGSPQFVSEQTAGLIQILFTLQKQNIAHRDIKPANILVFDGPQNSTHWKLADFGLALDLNTTQEQENFAGSFQYASPKLRRKFKYPNLKIKCNSFKNDVYSLGVTLLETITGFRVYNQESANKLKQICNTQRRLAQLIDMMLEEDEEKRPCFKQLMMLLQKDFKNQIENLEEQNKKQPNPLSLRKKTQSTECRAQQHVYDKTVVKHSELNEQIQGKKIIINVGKPIQCVANLDGIIMCGCDNGEVIFVKHGEVVEGGLIHRKMVSQLFVDAKENIWSVGGDNLIKKWSKNNLIKALISQTQQLTVLTDNFLKKPTKNTKVVLQLKQCLYQKIQLPFNHTSGVSSLFAIDANNFAVGYYDGYIYVRWNGGEYHTRFFGRPITAIKLSNHNKKLYFCGLDGQLKILQTTTLTPENRLFYRKGYSFINMHISQTEQQPCIISLLTLEGRLLLLKPNMQPIFESNIEKSGIMTSIENNQNCYMLMENGDIIDSSQEKIINLPSKGWNCLGVSTDRELIAGNFMGEIAIVQW